MTDNDTLAVVDFLNLAEQRKVAQVDLSHVGYPGVYYVCDMSTAVRQKIMGRMKGKARIHTDRSMDVEMANMPQDAPQKMVRFCLVQSAGDVDLTAKFSLASQNGSQPDKVSRWPTLTIPKSELTAVWGAWVEQLGSDRAVRDRVDELPHAVVNEIAAAVRAISGMSDQESLEEKKGN